MNVLVYQLEKEGLICPKCGENIQLDTKLIDDICLANNDINDNLIGIKGQIENIIICITNKLSIDSIKTQLKNINLIINNAIENLKKNNETLNKLKNISKEFTIVFNKKKITKKEDKAQFFDKIENLTNSEKIQAHSSYISNIIILQNDKIATSSHDHYIKIFNKDTFKEELSIKENSYVDWIEQIKDGTLISCPRDKTIRLYEISDKSYKNISLIRGNSCAWKMKELQSEKLISSMSNGDIKIWQKKIIH